MKNLASWLKFESKRGASAIEYGLLAAMVSLAIIGAASNVGWSIMIVFKRLNSMF